jgi:hypothetical protein
VANAKHPPTCNCWKCARRQWQLAPRVDADAGEGAASVDEADDEAICRECGEPFAISAGERRVYADRGFAIIRCPACRQAGCRQREAAEEARR